MAFGSSEGTEKEEEGKSDHSRRVSDRISRMRRRILLESSAPQEKIDPSQLTKKSDSKQLRRQVVNNRKSIALLTEEKKEETCTICLCDIAMYQEAKLDSCDHKFCMPCIKDWGENCENTCPNCKKVFKKIIWDDEVIKVENKKLKPEEEEYMCFVCSNLIYDEATAHICEVCNDVAVHDDCLPDECDSDYFICEGCDRMMDTLDDYSSEDDETSN